MGRGGYGWVRVGTGGQGGRGEGELSRWGGEGKRGQDRGGVDGVGGGKCAGLRACGWGVSS